MDMKRTGTFLKVDNKSLFVSEPHPQMFGNPRNADSNINWLKSRFHFAFAEYRNSRAASFGVLRVMNDDLVQANRGFGTHPHRNMEIITFVVDGFLTHKDSMGTKETIPRGSIQFMTAGSGIMHSEYNDSETDPLRFIQMWVTPRKSNLHPNYGSYIPKENEYLCKNNWAHLVSDVANQNVETPVKVNQDVNLFVIELNASDNTSFTIDQSRQGYLLCMEGNADFSDKNNEEKKVLANLQQHDAAEIKGFLNFNVVANSFTRLLIVEMEKNNDTRF